MKAPTAKPEVSAGLSLALLALFSVLAPATALAETQDPVVEAYQDFLAGFDVTLNEATIQLMSVVTALLLALWKSGGLSSVWLFYLLGIVSGGLIGAMGWISPFLPGYATALITGAVVAVSPNIGPATMRSMVTIIALVTGNAALSGYPWELIPLFGYLGVAAALVFGLLIVYAPARISLVLLAYPWVSIAWRAIAAWAVALAVLMIALALAYPSDSLQNWLSNWTGS